MSFQIGGYGAPQMIFRGGINIGGHKKEEKSDRSSSRTTVVYSESSAAAAASSSAAAQSSAPRMIFGGKINIGGRATYNGKEVKSEEDLRKAASGPVPARMDIVTVSHKEVDVASRAVPAVSAARRGEELIQFTNASHYSTNATQVRVTHSNIGVLKFTGEHGKVYLGEGGRVGSIENGEVVRDA